MALLVLGVVTIIVVIILAFIMGFLGLELLQLIIGCSVDIFSVIVNAFIILSLGRVTTALKTIWSHIWKKRLKTYQRLWLKAREYFNNNIQHRADIIKYYDELLERKGEIFFCSDEVRKTWCRLQEAYLRGDYEYFDELLEHLLDVIEREVG